MIHVKPFDFILLIRDTCKSLKNVSYVIDIEKVYLETG